MVTREEFTRRSANVLRSHRFAHQKGWTLKPIVPNYWTMTWLSSGSLTYTIGNATVRLGPGDVLLSPPDRRKSAHCTEARTTGTSLHLEIAPDPQLPLRIDCSGDEDVGRLFGAISRNWIERRPGADWTVCGLALRIIGLLSALASGTVAIPSDRRVLAVCRRLADAHREPIDITALAKEVQLSPTYLGVLFKRDVGVSIRSYANRMRVQRAMDMLETGFYTPSEAADQCGFPDIYYFSRLFRGVTGLSPRQWLSARSHPEVDV